MQAAEKYLRMAEASKLHSTLEKIGPDKDRSDTLDVALGIVTVSRNRHFLDSYEPHYLTQVRIHVLSQMTHHNAFSV